MQAAANPKASAHAARHASDEPLSIPLVAIMPFISLQDLAQRAQSTAAPPGRRLKGARRKATLTATGAPDRKRHPMFRLSQETIAIVTVGLALAGLGITSDNGIRDEIQAVRSEMQAMRAEARADREALRAEARADREALRTEARADREAWQAEARALRAEAGDDREALGRLTGIVEEVRTARR